MRHRAHAPLLAALVAACLFTAAALPARAAEVIERFESRLEVQGSGEIVVTETIAVVAEGRQIRRGIYRDFPTTYRDRYGNTVRVRFDVLAVRRDGASEPHRVQSTGDGQRVYIGDPDVFIARGRHLYELTYATDRQVGFFADFDEIYWNATGNDWAFPIERAVAVVDLPSGAGSLQSAAYTGRRGARGGDYVVERPAPNRVVFRTTRRLAPGEGLTVAVAFPKGYVAEPTPRERALDFLSDNLGPIAGLAGLVALLGYYLWAWFHVGRDPAPGTIVPLFEPPDGFSPAAARYVRRMGYDDRAFTAAILNMAVKGYLVIEEEGKEYRLRATGREDAPLSPGERTLAAKLFSGGDSILLNHANRKPVRAARESFVTYLSANFEKEFFRRNVGHWAPGIVITLGILAMLILGARDRPAALFMSVWLTAWTIGCVFLVRQALVAYRQSAVRGVLAALVPAVFIGFEMVGLGLFSSVTSWLSAAILLAAAGAGALFFRLMAAPTRLGRRILDEIEGFRMYLSVAERERLAALTPPDRTPELYERYLPYALALDVENEWAQQFDGVLHREDGSGWQPGWYRGSSRRAFSAGDVSSRLGSTFAAAVATASAPGSSSGSGGGGSSGGGGGGGGGGGW